jgi:SRSO17 transposase
VTKQDNTTAAPASIGDVLASIERADALVMRFLAVLMRQQRSLAAAMGYILALGRDVRANCWDLAERAGDGKPYRFHRLLRSYRWSWEDGREMLPGLAQQVLGTEPDDEIGPGLAVDETTDLKKGTATACVSPQHSGVTGRVENCVTWVFSALVTASAQAWAWFDLYMPEETWAKNLQRRKKAGIPGDLAFATKPQLAIAQVKTLVALGIRFLWVAADEVYGRSKDFRDTCRVLGLSYVVIIPCDYKVTLARNTAPARADEAAARAVFERRSAGNGTKGPRYSDWALIATASPDEFLMVRRLDRGENEYTYYVCHAAAGRPATLTYFVTIAGRRWPVETSFKNGKDAFGWDQSQARTWNGLNRHTLLTALAQIRVIALRNAMTRENGDDDHVPVPEPAPAPDPGDGHITGTDLRVHPGAVAVPDVPGLPCPAGIPPVDLSAAETARIDSLTRAYAEGHLTRARLAFHYRWSDWRRRHQARARWHHYSTRLLTAPHERCRTKGGDSM